MRILVCVKRVPAPGARINITADGQAIDTAFLGFTMSPHEECAVEEAVQQVEKPLVAVSGRSCAWRRRRSRRHARKVDSSPQNSTPAAAGGVSPAWRRTREAEARGCGTGSTLPLGFCRDRRQHRLR